MPSTGFSPRDMEPASAVTSPSLTTSIGTPSSRADAQEHAGDLLVEVLFGDAAEERADAHAVVDVDAGRRNRRRRPGAAASRRRAGWSPSRRRSGIAGPSGCADPRGPPRCRRPRRPLRRSPCGRWRRDRSPRGSRRGGGPARLDLLRPRGTWSGAADPTVKGCS